MCVVSMIGDHYRERIPREYPWIVEKPTPNPNTPTFIKMPAEVTKEEFEALKKTVEEMKELLLRAVKYDERNNEPHCEMEDKVALLKQVAEMVGVDLKDVFPDAQPKYVRQTLADINEGLPITASSGAAVFSIQEDRELPWEGVGQYRG